MSAPAAKTEPTTLAEVYEQHADFVWRTVRRLGVEPAQADDLCQEIFLVVQRRLPDFDGSRAALTSWLFGIARGVVANHQRGRKRAEKRVEHAEPPRAPADPEAVASRKQAAELVRLFLSELDDEKRIVFELVDIEGFKGPEAAAALDLDVKLVHSRLRSARERFREFVRERGHHGSDGE